MKVLILWWDFQSLLLKKSYVITVMGKIKEAGRWEKSHWGQRMNSVDA